MLVGDTRGLGPCIVGSNPTTPTRHSNRNQSEINSKISASMKGRSIPHPASIGHKHSAETKKLLSNITKEALAKHRTTIPYELRTKYNRKLVLFREQDRKCARCGQGESWNGKLLVLQLEHIDGDNKNKSRSNEELLCPNCHSQTETYCKMTEEEKKKHVETVTKAMKDYGQENRQRNFDKSPWKGIKYSELR